MDAHGVDVVLGPRRVARIAELCDAIRVGDLDEPFEGIDAIASRQIKDLLAGFVKGGGTIFVTSHILEIVERMCDHVGVIHRGKLVAQGPMEALRLLHAEALDFDDLLFNTDKLFKEHLEVLNKYQHRIHYILVDEFQDTNPAQFSLLKMLCPSENLQNPN